MVNYYCPYCSSKLQFQKRRLDGVRVCGLCGDPLIKDSLIKPTQLLALIVAFAFITPLFLMFLVFIRDFNTNSTKEPRQISNENTISIPIGI